MLQRSLSLLAIIVTAALAVGIFLTSTRAQESPAHDSAIVSPRAMVIASGADLSDIRGLALDEAGNVFISSQILPVPAACVARRVVAGLSLTLFSNCVAAKAEDPSGIAVSRDGSRIFLANREQNSIRLLDMLTGKVELLPPSPSGASHVSESLAASANPVLLAGPEGIAIDRAKNIYVADCGNNRVLVLGPASADFQTLAHVLDASAVAIDSAGTKVFVASPASNRIYQIDPSTGELSAFAGTGALPDSPPNSSLAGFPAPISPNQFALAAPEGIAVDAAGNVFIADTGANAIVRVDAATKLLSLVPLGSTLSLPGALAIDPRGDLFVADRGNHRVVEFAGVAAAQASGSVTLSPAISSFGNQPTGGTTPLQTFVLTNNSGSALPLAASDFSFSGNDPNDFMQTNNCLGQLATGASCQISVSFAPQGTGARAASLMVNIPSGPQSSSLTGTGDTFNLTAANQNAKMQTVVPGSPGKYTLSVTPDSVFGGAVALSCPIQLPDPTLTCSINPSQLTITPGQSSPFSVTITTTNGQTPPKTSFVAGPPYNFQILGLLLSLGLPACLFAWGILLKRDNEARDAIHCDLRSASRPRRFARAISASALLLAFAASGCGHSASPTNPVTPAGIFKIDITGTAQNAPRAITLTLNVE